MFLVGAGARKIPCAHTCAGACMNFVPIPELAFGNLQYHNNPPGIHQHQHSKHGHGQPISFAWLLVTYAPIFHNSLKFFFYRFHKIFSFFLSSRTKTKSKCHRPLGLIPPLLDPTFGWLDFWLTVMYSLQTCNRFLSQRVSNAPFAVLEVLLEAKFTHGPPSTGVVHPTGNGS